MKYCTRCGLLKADTDFSIKTKNKLSSHCKECHRRYVNDHYKRNKDYYKKKAKFRAIENKKWLVEFKSTLKCEQCGEDHPATLDFHHTNPRKKEGCISMMISSASREKILAEIKKCRILCSNCHRKFHWDRSVMD